MENTQQQTEPTKKLVFDMPCLYMRGKTVYSYKDAQLSIDADDNIALFDTSNQQMAIQDRLQNLKRASGAGSMLYLKTKSGERYTITFDMKAIDHANQGVVAGVTMAAAPSVGSGVAGDTGRAVGTTIGVASSGAYSVDMIQLNNSNDKSIVIPLLSYMKSRGVKTEHISSWSMAMGVGIPIIIAIGISSFYSWNNNEIGTFNTILIMLGLQGLYFSYYIYKTMR